MPPFLSPDLDYCHVEMLAGGGRERLPDRPPSGTVSEGYSETRRLRHILSVSVGCHLRDELQSDSCQANR